MTVHQSNVFPLKTLARSVQCSAQRVQRVQRSQRGGFACRAARAASAVSAEDVRAARAARAARRMCEPSRAARAARSTEDVRAAQRLACEGALALARVRRSPGGDNYQVLGKSTDRFI